MRILGLVGAIGLVVGLGVPAFAGDKNAPELFAVSQLSTHGTLQVMTDKQLTAVEGMSYKRHHGYHYGPIDQSNELSQYNVNQGCGCGKGHDGKGYRDGGYDGKGKGYYHGGEVSQDNFADQLNSVYGKHGSIDQSNWADQMNLNAGGRYGDVDQANSARQINTVGLPPMVR